jgi:hypothetical protein
VNINRSEKNENILRSLGVLFDRWRTIIAGPKEHIKMDEEWLAKVVLRTPGPMMDIMINSIVSE